MRPTPMPKSIRVGPHVYSVVRKTKAQMSDALGTCDPDSLTIAIVLRLRKSVAQETLLHEVLHAANYPSLFGKEQVTEEQVVEALGPSLLQILQQNPDLVEYLTN